MYFCLGILVMYVCYFSMSNSTVITCMGKILPLLPCNVYLVCFLIRLAIQFLNTSDLIFFMFYMPTIVQLPLSLINKNKFLYPNIINNMTGNKNDVVS